MRITVNDARSLAVALVQSANDKYLNWATLQWEPAPFSPANHARPLLPMEAPPSAFATIQTADIGYEMINRNDVEAVILAVSGTGTTATYTPVDVWTIPVAPVHCSGGFSRQ